MNARPGVVVVAGESRKISEEDRASFWRSKGEDSHILQEGVTGLWTILRSANKWRKTWPELFVSFPAWLRRYCYGTDYDTVGKHAQHALAACARYLFANGATKDVRHLFVKDAIHLLRNGRDEIRIEICGALSHCRPDLLGRFNYACAAASLEACERQRRGLCRQIAFLALVRFARYDFSLHKPMREKLWELFKSAPELMFDTVGILLLELTVVDTVVALTCY
ncbi:unnamed protein product [Symbiodinium sp. CCMP2592]|nr:unnamed protein product [Symbiodinium sp. CCMP2592]